MAEKILGDTFTYFRRKNETIFILFSLNFVTRFSNVYIW